MPIPLPALTRPLLPWASALTAASAHAHPGHGHGTTSLSEILAHLFSPDHLVMLAGGAVVLAALGYTLWRLTGDDVVTRQRRSDDQF